MLEFVSPIRNLYGTSTAPLRNLCGTSAEPPEPLRHLYRTSLARLLWNLLLCRTSAAPLRIPAGNVASVEALQTSAAMCAEPLPAGPLQNLCGTSTEPLRHLYTEPAERLRQHWNFQCRTSACGTFAEDLRNLCRTSAAALRNLSGTSTEPMQNLCGTSMDPRRNLCGTSTEPLQNLCCTAECVRRNLSPTSSAPPQKLCQRASSKPGTPERQHLCGTFPPPPQLLADPKPLQNLLSMELFRHSYAT